MAVEVYILSGARQGQRIPVDATEFRVGGRANCLVAFDPLQDAGAKDRVLWFRLTEEGWRVQADGGEGMLVNQQPVTGLMRVRSGDVVRLSGRGPDFSFTVVARSPVSSGDPAAGLSGGAQGRPGDNRATPPDEPAAAPGISPPAVFAPEPAPPAGVPPPAPVPPAIGDRAPVPSGPPVVYQQRWPSALWVVAAVMGLVLLVFLVQALTPTHIVVVPQSPPVVPAGKDRAASTGMPEPGPASSSGATVVKGAPSPPAPPRPDPQPPPGPAGAAPAPSPPEPVAPGPAPPGPEHRSISRAVYLIQVQKGKASFPFATCCAVAEDTLLTSAREALELAQWRRKPPQGKGFKAWVADETGQVKKEIRDIRLYSRFAAMGEATDDWIYFDLALLTVDGKLPAVARVATAGELGGVSRGQRVTCCGFPHAGDMIADSDVFRPVLADARIFRITSAPGLQSRSVLHLRASIPENVYGSPIVDAQDRVVAVYGEKEPPPGQPGKGDASAPSPLSLHYAPVVSAELIDQWRKEKNGRLWVSADLVAGQASGGKK
jgi:hypothetical protein